MISPTYKEQVSLLLSVLPHVAKEEIFALKGGTAINLFVRDMPRLSVDLDLTYLPLDPRDIALKNIQEGLNRIRVNIERNLPDITVHAVTVGDTEAKLNCQGKYAQVKIEVNTITRGNIFPVRLMQVVNSVQVEFGKFAAINVVSLAELYGGKICAAIDRQHPRDIFDVMLLFENEGLTADIWDGLIISIISHYKPIHELLSPILKDQQSAFNTQFAGMTSVKFNYDDYEKYRTVLVNSIQARLSKKEKEFLLSFEGGDPNWNLIKYPGVKDLPAIKWKLLNILKLKKDNPQKHLQLILNLTKTLNEI